MAQTGLHTSLLPNSMRRSDPPSPQICHSTKYHHRHWEWRQHILPTRQHGVTTQYTILAVNLVGLFIATNCFGTIALKHARTHTQTRREEDQVILVLQWCNIRLRMLNALKLQAMSSKGISRRSELLPLSKHNVRITKKTWLILPREIIIITIHKTHLKTLCANFWDSWSSSKSTQTIPTIMMFKMLIIISAGIACDAYRQELKRRYSVEWWELWITASATCYAYCAATHVTFLSTNQPTVNCTLLLPTPVNITHFVKYALGISQLLSWSNCPTLKIFQVH
jgi:hypothetical protein